MTDRVNQVEAAERLGVHKSTISRWVAKHPALIGDDGLIDLAELASQRKAKINPALQRRPAAEAVAAPAAPRRSLPAGDGYSDHRARRERVQADTAELELAERLARTVERARVEMAAAEFGMMLDRAEREQVRRHADRLVTIRDPREMEAALLAMQAEIRAAAVGALTDALGDPPPEETNAAA